MATIETEQQPFGTRFFDRRSRREMTLVLDGQWQGWLVYRHPDGQWVSLRRATDEDRAAINKAVFEAHHRDD